MPQFKTIVYIDAFNLYYGALKDTQYKWLDIQKLVENLLPKNTIIEVKYFYAPLKNSPEKHKKQKLYVTALQKHIPFFTTIKGYFIEKRRSVKNMAPPPDYVETLLREEKGTDVNIAVEIVKDSFNDSFEAVVLISNDGDLARSLQIAKENGKTIVVISPVKKERMKNYAKSLKHIAHHHFSYISESVLKNSLLPYSIGNIHCPKNWA